MRSTTFEMIGMTLMALMVLLVIGGGTTLTYLIGQRGAGGQPAVLSRGQASWQPSRPSAPDTLEESPASASKGRHGHRHLFLGP